MLLELLSPDYVDDLRRLNMIYPLARKKPNARYVDEIYHTKDRVETRKVLESHNVRFHYPGETENKLFSDGHFLFTVPSDFTYNRVGYASEEFDDLDALGQQFQLTAPQLATLESKRHWATSMACTTCCRNDSFPWAMYIAAALGVTERLMPAVKQLRQGLSARAEEWKDIVKIGRTDMQDATPITLGQEVSGYVGMLDDDLERLADSLKDLYRLVLGENLLTIMFAAILIFIMVGGMFDLHRRMSV